jgi:hypothetical protein
MRSLLLLFPKMPTANGIIDRKLLFEGEYSALVEKQASSPKKRKQVFPQTTREGSKATPPNRTTEIYVFVILTAVTKYMACLTFCHVVEWTGMESS